ncbi:MAG TPA: zf-HC2 domain-containing protein, partial [Thermoanaerobaculia bacterium]
MTIPEITTMNCPDEETLAAFIDGRLKGEARQRVVEHMANCADCRDIAVAANEYQPLPADVSHMPARSPMLKWSVVAAIAAVVVLAFGTMLRNRLISAPMTDLVEASESLDVRAVPARLSADFPHRRYQSVMRGGNDANES